jgi:protein DGCR14
MFNIDGAPLTEAEQLQTKMGPPKEISKKNTRFTEPVHETSEKLEEDEEEYSLLGQEEKELIRRRQLLREGKVVLGEMTPRVGGYSLLGTPSPRPGVDASPFMTWGEIESTPLRVETLETPLSFSESPFKVAQVPTREKLAWDLTDQVLAKQKKEAETKKKAMTPIYNPKRGGSTPLNTDFQLRASYGSTPKRTPSSSTPSKRLLTPTPRPTSTSTPKKK